MIKQIITIMLILTANLSIAQDRPSLLRDGGLSKLFWQKTSSNNVELSKNGYVYNNSEFLFVNLEQANGDLVIYSLAEDFTFRIKNFSLLPTNQKYPLSYENKFNFNTICYFLLPDESHYNSMLIVNGKVVDAYCSYVNKDPRELVTTFTERNSGKKHYFPKNLNIKIEGGYILQK